MRYFHSLYYSVITKTSFLKDTRRREIIIWNSEYTWKYPKWYKTDN